MLRTWTRATSSTGDKADVLVRLTTLVDRVEGLRLRVMAAAMDVADTDGAPTVAAWLAPRTRATTRSLHGREQLARGMDRRWQPVGAGVAAGTVSLAQAEVIVRALETLDAPAWGSGWTGSCWAWPSDTWCEKAAEFTPPALRALGERILEVICPERYDDQERAALLAAERRASAATRLTLHVRGDGSVDLRARIPEATAARLQTYLEAFTAPRRGSTQTTSRPLRHAPGDPAVTTTWTRRTGGGCPPSNAAARPSARCWRPSTRTGCRCTAAPRPRGGDHPLRRPRRRCRGRHPG